MLDEQNEKANVLDNLNQKQREAASEVFGPVICYAGAGTGKTRTLTYRIAHMISDLFISPSNILAITFTNKAANEMRERVSKICDCTGLTVMTFHAFCAMILRREAHLLGYSNGFAIIDEDDQLKIIHEILAKHNLDRKAAIKYRRTINSSKCFMALPSNPLERNIYNEYNETLLKYSLVDFEDLLLLTFNLFNDMPNILNKYQERYQFILVDEFQDTNTAQYKITKLLASKYQNLFVVGDEDQSIYSFRGTDLNNVNSFKEDFTDYKQFFLTENYRSSNYILECCNSLIKHNFKRVSKELFSNIVGSSDDVSINLLNSEYDEVNFAVEKVLEHKDEKVAILYRKQAISRGLEVGLINAKIPYVVYGGTSYLRRREVKDLIAYFRLILNPNDFISFKRVVNIPSRTIGFLTVETIEKYKNEHKLSIRDTLKEADLSAKKIAIINDFLDIIDKCREMVYTHSLVEVFDYLINEIGYIDFINAEYGEEGSFRIENIYEFKSILLIEDNSEMDRLQLLRKALDKALLNEELNNKENESESNLTISTIHSVKGLEFDVVIIIGCEEDIFPVLNDDLEEERRIAYVAITRAKRKVYLTHTKRRIIYGGSHSNMPSRFLYEMKIKKESVKKEDSGYNVSDKVIHKAFGSGIILSIKDGNATIFFDDLKTTKIIKLSIGFLSRG